MLPANAHFHLIIGVDIHVVTLPPPAPPAPLPHPFIGMLHSYMDYLPFIGATTMVNYVPRGNGFSNGKLGSEKHIPMGIKLVNPTVGHNSVNFFGAMKTKVEGNLFSVSPYMVMTCNDFGVPMTLSPPSVSGPGIPLKKKFLPPVPSLYLPLSASIPIPLGPPVLVGGPYVPDFAGLLKALAFSYLFGALLKAAGMALQKAFSKFDCTKGLAAKLCHMGFEPVDLITGRVLYQVTDFEMPGPLPVKWERRWYSDSGYEGILGHGTHLCYDLTLEHDYKENSTGIILPDGRVAVFPLLLNKNESFYNRAEKLTLINKGSTFELNDHDRQYTYIFRKVEKDIYKPSSLTNLAGFSINFDYDESGKLKALVDSVGRNILLHYDDTGRITTVQSNYKGSHRILVQYGYNENNDLSEITDALGKTTYVRFKNHLMTEKTDRNGQTFYWEYAGNGKGSKCIHTWGDNGLLEGKIAYHNGYNEVTNASGETTVYHYNHLNLCTKKTDPLGNSIEYVYTEFMELYREVDEEGNITGYTYDERGNLTSKHLPDGTVTMSIYNEDGQLQMKLDALNQPTVYSYNDNKLLRSVIYPDNTITAFDYNEKNLLSGIRNEGDRITRLSYDEEFNLSSVSLPNGSSNQWRYDKWGRCIEIVNPENRSQYIKYDELNRVIGIKKFDSNNVELRYDSYEGIVEAEDKHYKVEFSYNALGSLLARKQNKTYIRFRYDKDNRLRGIENEFNEHYTFKRNLKGEITDEIGFDGVARHYERDPAGKIIRTQRPGGKWTEYEYDLAGRLTRAEYSDGTWETYSYNRNGQLTEAVNGNSAISIKRDVMGRVVSESQDDYWIKSAYNSVGKRTQVTSSLGASINHEYNNDRTVSQTSALVNDGKEWKADFKYNSFGLETERNLPGNIQRVFEYDAAGNPVKEKVITTNRETLSRTYTWNVNYRLAQMVDQLTRGVVSYGHDDFGNLAWAQYEDGVVDYRMPDETGNLYKTKERNDRKYGAGGRLLESVDAFYTYDEEGNLVNKKEKNGKEWRYEWMGNGMLKKVVRPDGKEVCFEYDALGRRLSKTFNGKVTRWLWNGNVPLHEWVYLEKEKPQPVVNEFGEISNDNKEPVNNLVSWIFDEGSFKPAAKIDDSGIYSIITDYLGTPIEMYNDAGEKTWQAAYDIRGKIRKLDKGVLDDCPFRYQGQYEDVETGLSFNRYRYYLSGEGIYISQDPIGIKGKNPSLYAYTRDSNVLLDVFGLDTTLFRAVFGNEASDILTNNVIRNAPGGYETGKLFATSYDDAVAFGNLLQQWEDTEFKILTVNVPDDVDIHYFEADRMRAASIDQDDLSKLSIVSCK